MTRVRHFTAHAVMLAALLMASGRVWADRPPNVLLIISDDQAWTDYGFMGHPHIRTPNLDRLAAESLTFTRGYVPSSLCRPSLATIITGLYPRQHKIVGNDPAPAPSEADPTGRNSVEYRRRRQAMIDHMKHLDTLPRWLGRAGYVSHQSGKWWEGSYQVGGFTEGMTQGFPQPGGRHGDEGLKIGRQGLAPVLDFIRRAKQNEKPFFVWYAPFLPHTPHNPPERILKHYRSRSDSLPIAKYWAMCEWFDETCGELLGFLDDQQLSRDTLVVYVTDNGWINRSDRSAYAPRSKRSPYEGGIRTPIMFRQPGRIAPKRDDTTLASSIDLAPTILKACELDIPKDLPGLDLLDQQARDSRGAILGEIYSHDVVDIDNPSASLLYRWIIQDPWKLIVPNPARLPDARVEAYRILDDPHERNNIVTWLQNL